MSVQMDGMLVEEDMSLTGGDASILNSRIKASINGQDEAFTYIADSIIDGKVDIDNGGTLTIVGTTVGGDARLRHVRVIRMYESDLRTVAISDCGEVSAERIVAGKGIGDGEKQGSNRRDVRNTVAWRTTQTGTMSLTDSEIDGSVLSVNDGDVVITGVTFTGHVIVVHPESVRVSNLSGPGTAIIIAKK